MNVQLTGDAQERIERAMQQPGYQDAGGPDAQPEHEESLKESLERLWSAGRDLALAELDWARARAAYLGAAVQRIAIFGAVAFILALALIITLFVGALLALAPLIGIGWAILVVAVTGLLFLAGCALGIQAQVRRIKAMPR